MSVTYIGMHNVFNHALYLDANKSVFVMHNITDLSYKTNYFETQNTLR